MGNKVINAAANRTSTRKNYIPLNRRPSIDSSSEEADNYMENQIPAITENPYVKGEDDSDEDIEV